MNFVNILNSLWYAINHATGKILAYVLGSRKDEAFIKLKALLKSFAITRFYTDDWGAYERHLEPENPSVDKENTQKIERKNLTLRTRLKRLVRKTICFSKKTLMHDIIINFAHLSIELDLAIRRLRRRSDLIRSFFAGAELNL